MSSSSSSPAPPHVVEDCLGIVQLLSDGTVTRSGDYSSISLMRDFATGTPSPDLASPAREAGSPPVALCGGRRVDEGSGQRAAGGMGGRGRRASAAVGPASLSKLWAVA
uniref:Uncharacterized protein n=1 Tax=Oryza barthii TaxID=65489 RepID=A0A0D3GML1_9ORYZ